MSFSKTLLLAGLLVPALVAGTAHAAEPGFYIGASGGQTQVDQNANEFGYNGPFNIKLDDDDTGWKAYVGYNFFPWLGVEGGYVDFGNVSKTVFTDQVDVDLSGWETFVVGTLPVGPVDLFIKAGAIDLRSELSVSNQGSDNSNDTQFAYGAGVAYNYGNWALRLEAEGYDDNEIYDFYFLSGGITYRFDFDKPAPVAAAPVAAAPAACADSDGDGVCDTDDLCPGTPPGTRVESMGCNCDYSLNLEFAFDSAVLTPGDMAQLDEIIPVLTNPKTGFIRGVIEGHTDSIGSVDYNLGLSQRRAQSVADYLQSKGVELAGRFAIEGFGKANPIASNDTEAGRAQNRRVVVRRTDCDKAAP